MLFSSDTSPEARAVLIESFRAMTPARRLEIALDASETMRATIRADIATQHPEASADERRVLFLRRCFGNALADEVQRWMATGHGPRNE